ncbi:MAG: transcriptional repressor [Defluviitaleaceae bacterium]|nr:transcriptional repressor [Defluviitaleaceae bacterium]
MIRNTVQRKIIFDTLKGLSTHPTAEELLKAVQKEHPTIGRATVYRNLRQMADSGQVLLLTTADDGARYDGCTAPHCHFTCKACGGFYDVDADLDPLCAIKEAAEGVYGFEVDRADVTFIGTCERCLDAPKMCI